VVKLTSESDIVRLRIFIKEMNINIKFKVTNVMRTMINSPLVPSTNVSLRPSYKSDHKQQCTSLVSTVNQDWDDEYPETSANTTSNEAYNRYLEKYSTFDEDTENKYYFDVVQTKMSLSIKIKPVLSDEDYDDISEFSLDDEDTSLDNAESEKEYMEENKIKQDLLQKLYSITKNIIPSISFENFVKLLKKSSSLDTKHTQNE
jgi:hypothetical protein